MTIEIIHSECLGHMKTMPDNSIDCVLTDPPYGLAFMGKKWDYQLPSIEIWKELLRICKPGAPMLCFGGTRTYHRLTCMIEDSGWIIKDCLQYIYGSGFPKSCNFGRKLSDEWHGYGTALKPAYEPILLAMKPNDGTFSNNAEKWGVAGINIDRCRISCNGENKRADVQGRSESFLSESKGMFTAGRSFIPTNSDLGRWPANVILDEESAMILDQQSGFSKSSPNMRKRASQGNCYGQYQYCETEFPYLNDSGGASRFFYCAKASASERNAGCEVLPLKEAFKFDGGPKINQWTGKLESEQKMRNNHPTVKPQKLLQYLLKLIMPPNPNAIVIDPFAGSGSTLVAAKQLGYNAIGIEMEKDYIEICKARVSHICKDQVQYDLFEN